MGSNAITADQPRIFIGLEIRQTDDHGLGIERGGDDADAFRELLDEVVGRASVIANQPLNGLLRRRRCHLLRIDQRHRMNADVLADDELHPRQTDPIVRQHGCPEGKLRVPQIQHNGGARPLEIARLDLRRLEWKLAVVDATDLSLGAGHRHDATGLQSILRSCRPDYGRNAEFACDNRRMAGPSAALCHDRGGNLHDRLPIRARRLRDENLARLERRKLMSVGNDPCGPNRDLLADCATRGQHRGRPLEGIAFERRRRSARGHGLGSSLNDIELPIIGILGPFNVHRHRMPGIRRVMVLDSDRVVGKLEHLRVVDTEALPGRPRNGNISCAAMVTGIDHAHLLASERSAQDRAIALAKGRLVDVELVGIDRSLDNIFAQPVDAGDEHDIAKAGFGIQREDDTARSAVGSDHLHDSDRERDLEMIEAVVDPIRDRPIGEDGSEAAPAGFEQIARRRGHSGNSRAGLQSSPWGDPRRWRSCARQPRRWRRTPFRAADRTAEYPRRRRSVPVASKTIARASAAHLASTSMRVLSTASRS